MKNFKLFFYTFTLLILFSSCTKDELTNSEKIVGKWKMTDFHGTTEATTSNSLMTITASSVQTGSNYNSFIDFTEDPNNYTITGSFNTHITTTTVTVIGGETTTIVGNATTNAKPHAFNQIVIIPSTNPTLKMLITSDIMHDISKDMKNENT